MAGTRYELRRYLDALHDDAGTLKWDEINDREVIATDDVATNLATALSDSLSDKIGAYLNGKSVAPTTPSFYRVKYDLYDTDESHIDSFVDYIYFYANGGSLYSQNNSETATTGWLALMAAGTANAYCLSIGIDSNSVNLDYLPDTSIETSDIFDTAELSVGKILDKIELEILSVERNLEGAGYTDTSIKCASLSTTGANVSSLVEGMDNIVRSSYGGNQVSIGLTGSDKTKALRYNIPGLDWSGSGDYDDAAFSDIIKIKYQIWVNQTSSYYLDNEAIQEILVEYVSNTAASLSIELTEAIYEGTTIAVVVDVE